MHTKNVCIYTYNMYMNDYYKSIIVGPLKIPTVNLARSLVRFQYDGPAGGGPPQHRL